MDCKTTTHNTIYIYIHIRNYHQTYTVVTQVRKHIPTLTLPSFGGGEPLVITLLV